MLCTQKLVDPPQAPEAQGDGFFVLHFGHSAQRGQQDIANNWN